LPTNQVCAAFDDLPWHDAELLGLVVDRRDPGHVDEVRLQVRWPDGRVDTLTFFDCLLLEAAMNFGVIAAESILMAQCHDSTAGLARLRDKWSISPRVTDGLVCFEIEMNSTASLLRIYAKGFRSDPDGT
jgi:hypothetical protein